ncbi:prorelaxin-like [Macrotis lagotis]|uniref:prorelaxin-like n=1 Tax=Macrotis lagotis TaxID=92651 RepID=UPI003D68E239
MDLGKSGQTIKVAAAGRGGGRGRRPEPSGRRHPPERAEARAGAEMLPLHLLGAWLLLSLLPAPGSPQEVDDAPLQVCGREFVRAVLSICGAPSWRRDRKPQRQPGRALGQFYVSGESDGETKTQDVQVTGRKQPGVKEQSTLLNQDWELLKNILLSHDGTKDSSLTKEELLRVFDELKEAIEKKRIDIRATNPLKQHDFIMGTYSRKKRETVLGLADRCCSVSCTKNEIARLC